MELSVIVPCFNEEPNLAELTARVAKVFEAEPFVSAGAELVLVDDGSRDGTLAAIERAAAAHPFVVPCRHDRNRGLAAAWRTGLAAATGQLVCILDADLQYRPEDIPRLYEVSRTTGADLVQGWRSLKGRARDSRYLISRGLSVLLNCVFGMRLRDNKSGFILCRREVLADLLGYRMNYTYWQIFLLVAAHARGYRLVEVETVFEPRRAGSSFLSPVPVMPILRACVDVGRAVIEYRL